MYTSARVHECNLVASLANETQFELRAGPALQSRPKVYVVTRRNFCQPARYIRERRIVPRISGAVEVSGSILDLTLIRAPRLQGRLQEASRCVPEQSLFSLVSGSLQRASFYITMVSLFL